MVRRNAVMGALVVAASLMVVGAGAGLALREPRVIEADRFVASGMVEPGLTKEVVVNATPEEVFKTWTTSKGYQAFMGVESSIDLRIGGPMEVYIGRAMGMPEGQQGSEGCQILSYVPNEMFSFSRNAPPKFAAERELRTWVVVTMWPTEEGTQVRLRHVGFGEGGNWDEVEAHFDNAWTIVLAALKDHFEKKE
jgi:uncharacterized protein YndB with AHSA1/START domain